ncbi:hypothetical protein B0H14DRAFT_3117977 [Mycena olivaceomarginata]|nr:hypothetical protein B0H14DRAFT_3117977 [Mycena olivaceomarginata]
MSNSLPKTSGYVLAYDPSTPRSSATMPFREIIPRPDHPKIAGISQIEASSWLINRLEAKHLERPIQGFTVDGNVQDGLAAPVEAMVSAANALLGILSPQQQTEVSKGSVNDDEFRLWSNPELYVNPGGLRKCTPQIQGAVHTIIRASTSTEGFAKIIGCTLTNGFSGNSSTARRIVIGPTFMGAEPDRIDEGPHAGLRLFTDEEIEALNLMRKAQISKTIGPEGLPQDRWNPFDERHLGGARQDNQGCPVSHFTSDQKAAPSNIYLPTGPLVARIKLIEEHLDETYFAWIGGFELSDPYYFRLHSPVAFCELDFPCGIFLTNTSPAKCHIHTIKRLPNYWRLRKGAAEAIRPQ